MLILSFSSYHFWFFLVTFSASQMNHKTLFLILLWAVISKSPSLEAIRILVPDAESRPNNLLEAYFKHRAAHNSLNNNILSTNGRNHLDPDYDIEDAREPGSFVKLREPKERGWLGLSQAVSPHRDEMRAASMIQVSLARWGGLESSCGQRS